VCSGVVVVAATHVSKTDGNVGLFRDACQAGAVSFKDCEQEGRHLSTSVQWAALGVCVLWCGVAVAATHRIKLDSNVGLFRNACQAGVL
jgi:hypothetical protein